MHEEVRNQYAEALDLTSDEGDYTPPADEGEAIGEDTEEFEPIPASVSAALRSPIRKDVGMLLAGAKTTAAVSILNGSQSLV